MISWLDVKLAPQTNSPGEKWVSQVMWQMCYFALSSIIGLFQRMWCEYINVKWRLESGAHLTRFVGSMSASQTTHTILNLNTHQFYLVNRQRMPAFAGSSRQEPNGQFKISIRQINLMIGPLMGIEPWVCNVDSSRDGAKTWRLGFHGNWEASSWIKGSMGYCPSPLYAVWGSHFGQL